MRLGALVFQIACEAIEAQVQEAMDRSMKAVREGDVEAEQGADAMLDRALAKMDRLIEEQIAVRGEKRPAAPALDVAA